MRQTLTTVLEVAGLACVASAAFLVTLPLGLFVAGACLVLIGVSEGRK